MTDTEIMKKGYNILIKEMGLTDAEKFISLVISDPGDYTKLRKNLFSDKSVSEMSFDAMNHRAKETDPQK
ncbi:MAG: hypothetical protein IPL16_01685 [Ignavibacteria bacterium]|nr:hypothetical protein [Ignavibacteria bacterium]